MAYNYDKLYGSTPQALGEPTSVFVEFFQGLTGASLRILDVGCGQGRDALFIARMGHRVVGVDLSPNGIRDMVAAAERENLQVEGIVADITSFVPEGTFDILLIDRTLHMLPKDAQPETLGRLIRSVSETGWVLIADERSNMEGFKRVFANSPVAWSAELDKGGTLFMRRS
ncbi:class I SAM-dependent methyltransferase [Roseovarius sp. 2305UL8-3]|uniref:class I SAM-dependent methyltransferase n=1 Tax=Roseovarius conchicola TaxID=3121636 RepID=UPI0035272CC5